MARIVNSVCGLVLGILTTHPSFAQEAEPATAEPAEGATSAPAAESASAPAEASAPAPSAPEVEPAPEEPAPIPATPAEVEEEDDPSPPAEKGPPTVFGKKMAVGGFGSFDAAYTRMFGRNGALLGLQAAVLLDHRLSIGAAAYGWTNPARGPNNEFGERQRYETGYLGGLIRWAFLLPNCPIYPSAGLLIGGGAVALAPDRDDRDRNRYRDDDDDVIDRDNVDLFAVFQPDVTVHANLTRWMRLGVTVGYRLTTGVGRLGYSEGDVNGIVAGGNIQFGYF